jgi:hypothetical protein
MGRAVGLRAFSGVRRRARLPCRYAGDPKTLAILERVLTEAGVAFIDENGGGPGVRLRSRGFRAATGAEIAVGLATAIGASVAQPVRRDDSEEKREPASDIGHCSGG